jgi:hypothetical protein
MVTEERRLAGINGMNVATVKKKRSVSLIFWIIVPVGAIVLGGWFLTSEREIGKSGIKS